MKKIINSKTIPYIVMLCSLIGLALRWWTIKDGTDAFGLYPSKPVVWWILWLFTAVMAVMILFAVRPLKKSGSYEENYPKSVSGMAGSILAGCGILVTSLMQLGNIRQLGFLDQLVIGTGILAGIFLIILGVFRFSGKKPNFLIHGLICLYFGLRMFNCCRTWSDEPQIGIIVLPFLASLTLMLASYQRTCFDVDLGNRRHSLLWSLLGVYFCVLAILSFEQVPVYGGCALWLATDLCSLRPVEEKEVSEAPEEPTVDPLPECENDNPEQVSTEGPEEPEEL